jgi:hypothetical protein
MSEAEDFIPAFPQDFDRLLREYRTSMAPGCEVLGKMVTLRDLRANIDNLVRNLGNIEQTRDAVGDELTAGRTIWTQLANALAPTATARRSKRIARNPNTNTGTESEQIQAAAAQGVAEALAAETRAHLLQLSTSHLIFNYTRSTTPEHYCELEIHAHQDRNVLGTFQIWWVPGADNLFIFYFRYPAHSHVRLRHAQAGAAEVQSGGGDDVSEHNNAAAARAASDSHHDAGVIEAAGGDGETQSDSHDENNPEAQSSSAGNSSSQSSDSDHDAGDGTTHLVHSQAQEGEEGSRDDGETQSDSHDENNPEAQSSSAGNSSSQSSDSETVKPLAAHCAVPHCANL